MFATLHITLRRHICLTEAIILSSTSNFFTTIASLCNNIMTSKQKFNNVTFFVCFIYPNRSLKKHSFCSAGSKRYVCMLQLVN